MRYEGWESIQDLGKRVRSALGIDESEITQTELAYYENAPMSEDIIKSKVTFWEELNDTDVKIFEACVVYQIAINMLRKTTDKNFKVEQSSSIKVERFESDFDILADLEERLQMLLNKLLYGTYEYEEVGRFTVTNR